MIDRVALHDGGNNDNDMKATITIQIKESECCPEETLASILNLLSEKLEIQGPINYAVTDENGDVVGDIVFKE